MLKEKEAEVTPLLSNSFCNDLLGSIYTVRFLSHATSFMGDSWDFCKGAIGFFPRISGSPSKNKFLQRSNVTLIYITGSVKITEKELVEQVISVGSGTLQILTFLSVASNARNARSNAERNGEAESCWSRVNNCQALSVTSNARNTRSNAERNDEAKSCRSRVNNCQEPSKDRIIKIYTPNKTLDSDWTRVEHFSDPILLCTVPFTLP